LSRASFGLELLWKERFLLVLPADHPWAAEPDVPLPPEDLIHTQIIMTGRFQPETLLAHPMWRDLGGYPQVEHGVRNPQSLLALVESGAGIGLTTELSVAISRPHDVILRQIGHSAALREV